uniref:Uncharacterized protein n=1 Tax=Manihot esculenta TaxID=3983 RepID=A0A2C9VVR3_MANES
MPHSPWPMSTIEAGLGGHVHCSSRGYSGGYDRFPSSMLVILRGRQILQIRS